MTQNKAAVEQYGSLDHTLLLPSSPPQSDIQWLFGTAKIEAIHLKQFLDHPPSSQYQHKVTLDHTQHDNYS